MEGSEKEKEEEVTEERGGSRVTFDSYQLPCFFRSTFPPQQAWSLSVLTVKLPKDPFTITDNFG